MRANIPNWTYLEEYTRLKDEIHQAVERVFASGRLILGPEVETFEHDFSEWCGVKFGVGVNSGTDAIFLALKALNVGPGDEVITVPNTAVPTVSALRATGATPVFVDIDPDTYLMNTSLIEAKITPKTKVIMPVHLYGQMVDMDPILALAKKYRLKIVEDCAQAHGSTYQGQMAGSLGTIGAFSFYPTKLLGGYGDAGMCVTNDARLARKLRMIRMYGMSGTYYSDREGYNTRLDEVQAAILLVKLKRLETMIRDRQQIARQYDQALKQVVKIPTRARHSTHSYYLYVAAHPRRDWLISQMAEKNIELRIHFPFPIHTMKAYRFLGYRAGDFPVAERAAKEIFSLPLYPFMDRRTVSAVVTTLREALKRDEANE